jgi:hypothetical protein
MGSEMKAENENPVELLKQISLGEDSVIELKNINYAGNTI